MPERLTMKKWLWITLPVILLDRVTKLLAEALTGPVTLIPGVLGLRYARNTGAAFSLLRGHTWLLGLVSLAVVLLVPFLMRRYRATAFTSTAAAMFIGGTLSNGFDRLFLGGVTDLFEVLLFRFAIFNTADVFICIGCAMMAFSLLLRPQDWETK